MPAMHSRHAAAPTLTGSSAWMPRHDSGVPRLRPVRVRERSISYPRNYRIGFATYRPSTMAAGLVVTAIHVINGRYLHLSIAPWMQALSPPPDTTGIVEIGR